MKAIPSSPVGWFRKLTAVGLAAVTLTLSVVLFIAPVSAQDDTPAADAETRVGGSQQEIDAAQIDIVRDDSTSDTIQRIRRDLAIIALVLTAALVVYVWHTNPSRRLRVASRHVDSSVAEHREATRDLPPRDGLC